MGAFLRTAAREGVQRAEQRTPEVSLMHPPFLGGRHDDGTRTEHEPGVSSPEPGISAGRNLGLKIPRCLILETNLKMF